MNIKLTTDYTDNADTRKKSVSIRVIRGQNKTSQTALRVEDQTATGQVDMGAVVGVLHGLEGGLF